MSKYPKDLYDARREWWLKKVEEQRKTSRWNCFCLFIVGVIIIGLTIAYILGYIH